MAFKLNVMFVDQRIGLDSLTLSEYAQLNQETGGHLTYTILPKVFAHLPWVTYEVTSHSQSIGMTLVHPLQL